MPNGKNRKLLEDLISKSIPPVVHRQEMFFIFRSTDLMIVEAQQLRIGDIRLLSLPAKDLVTGLSDFQWNTLLRKFRTLIGAVDFAVKHKVKQLEQ